MEQAEGIKSDSSEREHETVEGYEVTSSTSTAGGPWASRRTPRDADLSPFFSGLPNDECQCVHIGYVIKGKVAFRSGAPEEVFEAGAAYYVGPGHTPILYAGTEVVEFSPTEVLGRTMDVVTKNMEEMGASS